MTEKHSLHRRSHLLDGMPPLGRLPRRQLRTGTGPSLRDPGQMCQFSERIGLSEEELDAIAKRINAAGQAGQAAGHADPMLAAAGAPSHESLNRLLDEAQADLDGDGSLGKPDGAGDDDLFIDEPALLDLGTAPWPARNR